MNMDAQAIEHLHSQLPPEYKRDTPTQTEADATLKLFGIGEAFSLVQFSDAVGATVFAGKRFLDNALARGLCAHCGLNKWRRIK